MEFVEPDGGWGAPQLNNLVNFLKNNGFSAAKAAKSFGRGLGVPEEKLDSIYKDEDDSEERLVAIIQHFFNNEKVSWAKLAEALKNCGYRNLSEFILQNTSVKNHGLSSQRPPHCSIPEDNIRIESEGVVDLYKKELRKHCEELKQLHQNAYLLTEEYKQSKETHSLFHSEFLNVLTTANKLARQAMNLTIQIEDGSFKNWALISLENIIAWISMQEKIHLAHMAEDITRKQIQCQRNGTRRDSSSLFHRESKLEEESGFHFSVTFLNELTTANKFTRETMSFIHHHESDAGVQKVVLNSLSDLSDWTSKEKKILLAHVDDDIARNQVRRSGKAASSLLGASGLGGKLTPEQMNSLRKYINKLISALQHFQCLVS